MSTTMATIPLEDAWNDILGKAIRGSAVDEKNLAASANIIPAKLKSILQGELPSDDTLRRLAIAVGLSPTPFLNIAKGKYMPKPFDAARWPGVAGISSQYMDYRVNCYIVWDLASKEAVLFDTGTELSKIEEIVQQNGLKVKSILITHTHGDHIAVLEDAMKKFGCPAYSPKGEVLPNTTEIAEGYEFSIGKIKGTTKLTDGHSVGHLTFILSSSDWPASVAIVGDTVFAGSMGGGMISYTKQKFNIQDKILTLDPESLLCPGHGPMTTVGEECLNNPFA